MLKCRQCRSLLLGDVESCPRCGAPVPVAVGVAPEATASPGAPPAFAAPRAPSYGRLSIPSPVAAAPVAATVGSTPATTQPAYDTWQPDVTDTPVKVTIAHKPWARVALAVAIVLVVGAAILHLRSDPLPAGTSDYVAGKGVTYTSPDGAFQVQLPQQPQVTEQTFSLNGVNVPLYMGVVESNSYVIDVASIMSPPALGKNVDYALKQLAAQRVKSAHGVGVQQVTTMHGAEPALEARFKVEGHVAHMLVVATKSSAVVVLVAAKTGTDRLYKVLVDSLLIR
jgi:hypothetical protein